MIFGVILLLIVVVVMSKQHYFRLANFRAFSAGHRLGAVVCWAIFIWLAVALILLFVGLVFSSNGHLVYKITPG